jgi:hypothetical protein
LVYEDEESRGTEIYGFSESEYITSNLVRSYITNPNGFTSVSGWKQKEA